MAWLECGVRMWHLLAWYRLQGSMDTVCRELAILGRIIVVNFGRLYNCGPALYRRSGNASSKTGCKWRPIRFAFGASHTSVLHLADLIGQYFTSFFERYCTCSTCVVVSARHMRTRSTLCVCVSVMMLLTAF